jgi:two-component system chemotaxis response regulator CheB
VEYVAKPRPGVPGEHNRFGHDLVAAAHRAAVHSFSPGGIGPSKVEPSTPAAAQPEPVSSPRRPDPDPGEEGSSTTRLRTASQLIVVGTSTGGPAALRAVLPHLRSLSDAALIIIQHMPHTFTRSLARRLDAECAFPVHEAHEGESLAANIALMAPGDYHLLVTSTGQVHLNREPPIHGVRPSLDITLESAARQFGGSLLAVILTGMGVDGARGAAAVKAHGGSVFAEHSSTAVVYGMPRAVVEQGSADQVVPLHEMSEVISSWIEATSRATRRSARTMRTPVIG